MTVTKTKITALELFSRNLRLRRAAIGVSQEEVAAQAGLTQTFLSQVETGGRNLSMASAEKIALALGVELIDLLKK